MPVLPLIEPIQATVRMMVCLEKLGLKYFSRATVIGYSNEYVKQLTNQSQAW